MLQLKKLILKQTKFPNKIQKTRNQSNNLPTTRIIKFQHDSIIEHSENEKITKLQ